MLRYAHTISSASRRLASRHPMFCDPCTAGPRQFYPLRNNNLTPSVYIVPRPSNIADIDSITIWGVWAVKNGKTVYLQFNFDGTMVAGTEWKILFTLPQTYCPSVGTVIVNYNTQKGKPMIITIETNGRVKIICSSGEAIPEGDWICRQCITYVTEA